MPEPADYRRSPHGDRFSGHGIRPHSTRNHGAAALAHWGWAADGGVPPRWTRPPRWPGLWIPAIVSLIIQVPPLFFPQRFGIRVDAVNRPGELAFAIAIMAIGPLALLAARRFPGPVIAIVAAASAVAMLYGGEDWPPYISLGFAIIAAIVRGARVWAWISVATAWVTTLTVALAAGVTWHPLRIAGITLGILIVFGIGEAIRGRREHFEEFRRLASERRLSAEQAERMRLARELHDVLAHSLSQINVQAGVGLHLMESQPQKAADALASIKLTSKTALDEVRSVLGILRSGANPDAPLVPEPDLSRLAGLAASITEQGVTVTLDNRLDAPPPAAIQLAIYRIVQESLTNVLRHAHATKTTVTLSNDDGEYVVRIADNGSATPLASESGRGLLGMRERAELLGGRFSAVPRKLGGFEVIAVIPVPAAQL
jgi:signal transduction histidine kinase